MMGQIQVTLPAWKDEHDIDVPCECGRKIKTHIINNMPAQNVVIELQGEESVIVRGENNQVERVLRYQAAPGRLVSWTPVSESE